MQDKVSVTYGKSALEAQLELSSDKLINKMLFYLSRLPLQFSFHQMTEDFHKLVPYQRFSDYVERWFNETNQMKNVSVLNTDHSKGTY